MKAHSGCLTQNRRRNAAASVRGTSPLGTSGNLFSPSERKKKKTRTDGHVAIFGPTTNESCLFFFLRRLHHRQRLASGRCELASPWAEGGETTPLALAPDQAQVAVTTPPPSPPLLRFPQRCGHGPRGRTASLLRRVICRYLPPQSRPERTSPAAEAAPLSFASSSSPLSVAPHPGVFSFFFFSSLCFTCAIKSSLNPEKAPRARRQRSTLPLRFPSGSPRREERRRRGPRED